MSTQSETAFNGVSLSLVTALAHRVMRTVPGWLTTIDDLFQEGALALVSAAERYDPSRGVTFLTYAYPSIRGAMLDHVRRTWRAHGYRAPTTLPETPAPDTPTEWLLLTRTLRDGDLLRLTEPQAQALGWWLIGESGADLARDWGVHPTTVLRHRMTALRTLRGDHPRSLHDHAC